MERYERLELDKRSRSSNENPCKDCTERHKACHATCERYIENKKRIAKARHESLKKINANALCNRYTRESVEKIRDMNRRGMRKQNDAYRGR